MKLATLGFGRANENVLLAGMYRSHVIVINGRSQRDWVHKRQVVGAPTHRKVMHETATPCPTNPPAQRRVVTVAARSDDFLVRDRQARWARHGSALTSPITRSCPDEILSRQAGLDPIQWTVGLHHELRVRSLFLRLASFRKQLLRHQQTKGLKVMRAERSYWAGLS